MSVKYEGPSDSSVQTTCMSLISWCMCDDKHNEWQTVWQQRREAHYVEAPTSVGIYTPKRSKHPFYHALSAHSKEANGMCKLQFCDVDAM